MPGPMGVNPDPPDAGPTTPKSSPHYRVALTLGRLLTVAGVIAGGFGGMGLLAALLAGGAHGDVGGVGILLLVLPLGAVCVPLLLWWPDRGPGSGSRTAHALGALALPLSVLLGRSLWMSTIGEDEKVERDTLRLAQGVTISGVRADPIMSGGATIGYHFQVQYELREALPRYLYKTPGLGLPQPGESVRHAMAHPDLALPPPEPPQHDRGYKFLIDATKSSDGWPMSSNSFVLPAGSYTTVPLQLLFPGISRDWSEKGEGWWCRMSLDHLQDHLGQHQGYSATQRWVMRVTVRAQVKGYGGTVGAGVPVLRIDSLPFVVPFDGAAWREKFAALALPPCRTWTDPASASAPGR